MSEEDVLGLVPFTDVQLIQELNRRCMAVDGKSMIIAIAGPDEDNLQGIRSTVSVSANDGKQVQLLVANLAERFKLIGLSDGRVEVPDMQVVGQELVIGSARTGDPVESLKRGLLKLRGIIEVSGGSVVCLIPFNHLQLLLIKAGFSQVDNYLFRQDSTAVYLSYQPASAQSPATLYISRQKG